VVRRLSEAGFRGIIQSDTVKRIKIYQQ